MSVLSAIGLGTSLIGGLLGAKGASDSAKALKKASKRNRKDINALYTRQSEKLDTLIDEKESKLYDLGNIFDRFESTGAFGDTEVLADLRQAQSDFGKLAAGDFSGFEAQLRKTLSDTLISTVGAGAPTGTFAGLAADQQMNYRLQGLNTATSITDFLANQSRDLLGLEFGIMDQSFNTGYQMDAQRTEAFNNERMRGAGAAGIGTTAFGGLLSSFGASLVGLGQNREQRALIRDEMALKYGDIPKAQGSVPRALPIDYYGTPSAGYVTDSVADFVPDGIPTAVQFPLPDSSIYGSPLVDDGMVLPPKNWNL